MIAYQKCSLYAALLGALAAPGTSEAVSISTNGRGQVLLYPYYTTRADGAGNAYSTLLSVVNPTTFAKGVRVRFLEGRNSREVLAFNLFLSPFDVWTAAVLPDPATGGARLGTLDKSCTLPALSALPSAPFVSFYSFNYMGANDDGAGTGPERVKEGYFEIIEMATYNAASVTGRAITHVAGVPPCDGTLNDTQAASDALPLGGGLFGSATLINVNSGTDYTEEPTALDNFYQIGAIYQPAGSTMPNLTTAAPPISVVVAPNGNIYTSTWPSVACGVPTGCVADPVSAVLMHDSVLNEYVLDSATKSGTDWVVTMPTKRFYVNPGTGNAPRLFQRNLKVDGACDDVRLNIYDREERTTLQQTSSICWEANVITFNNSNVLGSANVANFGVPFENGWLNMAFPTGIAGANPTVHQLINVANTRITFVASGTFTVGNTTTYMGLPTIGFAVTSFANGTLQVGTPPVTVLSNYGGNFKHSWGINIQ